MEAAIDWQDAQAIREYLRKDKELMRSRIEITIDEEQIKVYPRSNSRNYPDDHCLAFKNQTAGKEDPLKIILPLLEKPRTKAAVIKKQEAIELKAIVGKNRGKRDSRVGIRFREGKLLEIRNADGTTEKIRLKTSEFKKGSPEYGVDTRVLWKMLQNLPRADYVIGTTSIKGSQKDLNLLEADWDNRSCLCVLTEEE